MNSDFIISNLVKMIMDDTESTFDKWDIVIAQGKGKQETTFAGIEHITPVKRGFAYRKDTSSIQMSGKNSRLGSKDLAKGGLTKYEVEQMESLVDNDGNVEDTDLSLIDAEKFSVSTDQIRWSNNLKTTDVSVGQQLLIPGTSGIVYKVKPGETEDPAKRALVYSIDYPVVGLSIGIPYISGKMRQRIKYKINKRICFKSCKR